MRNEHYRLVRRKADQQIMVCAVVGGKYLPVCLESSIESGKVTIKRLRKNAARRERDQAMRDLGLVRTPYGWE